MLFNVVIPTYNNKDELIACIKSLELQTIKEFHLLICVDGSTDGTVDWLEKHRTDFQFSIEYYEHADHKNKGRAATRNLAISHLTSPYTLFLDSDLIADPTLLEAHLNIVTNGNLSQGNIQYTDKINLWTDYEMYRFQKRFLKEKELPSKNILTGNVAIPTRYIKDIGGFEEEFVAYGGEDALLGIHLRKKFPNVIFVPNKVATVSGMLNKSIQQGLEQKFLGARENLKKLAEERVNRTDFNIDKLESSFWKAVFNYMTTIHFKERALFFLEKQKLPTFFTRKIIHLLIFYVTYKGYHQL